MKATHAMTPSSPSAAQRAASRSVSVPLGSVRLLDGDFKAAQDTSLRYVLALDADRLCAPYLREAGLAADAHAYGNWESDGLGGHIGGHYLSACAQLFAATGDERLQDRLDHVLDVFERCQRAVGTGYVGGIPGGRALGDELASGIVDADLFTLNGRWVPLYNLHKTLAGLLDSNGHAGSARALELAIGLADWWLAVSEPMPDSFFEEMLRTEFGGMMEAFAILAHITGRNDYVQAARRFVHRAILDPLADGRDALDGLHANTQIPKAVGYAQLGDLAGDEEYLRAADTFWDIVVSRRSVSIGGNSVREHFHPAEDFSPMIQDVQGPETCNTYNMLKLAKLRFERTGDVRALDFYERASYNHILSSQRPGQGGFVYFTPMRPAHYRVYSTPQESMWCCVGSGLENHARYGELIYSHTETALWVNLYLASELDWAGRGVRVRLETDLPRTGTVRIHIIAASPTELEFRLRRPGWATEMEVDVDGVPQVQAYDGGYVPLRRVWNGTTTVTVRLAIELHAEPLPDGSPWVSYVYGPVVLASRAGTDDIASFDAADERMGHVADGPKIPLARTPIVVAPKPTDAVVLRDRRTLTAEVTARLIDLGDVTDPTAGGNMTARGDFSETQIVLEPFAGIHDERYTVYWPTAPTVEAASALMEELRAADASEEPGGEVIDAVSAGQQQPEADHHFSGEGTRAGGQDGVHWRSATGWFSYALKDPLRQGQVLRVRFRAAEGRANVLRLNGALLPPPITTWVEGVGEVSEYPVTDAHRGSGTSIVFRLEAPAGALTGDLLTVQLLRTGQPLSQDPEVPPSNTPPTEEIQL